MNSTYLLAAIPDTSLVIFKFFILQLPDEGNGFQMVFPFISWQEYGSFFPFHTFLVPACSGQARHSS